MNKNLVLGLVHGYQFQHIRPFLSSLVNSGYNGDICLLISGLSPATMATLKEYSKNYKIILHPVNANVSLFSIPYTIKNSRLLFKTVYPYQLRKISLLNKVYVQIVKLLSQFDRKNMYRIKSSIIKNFLTTWCVRYPLYWLYLYKLGNFYSNVMLTDVRDVLFQKDPFDFSFNGLCFFLEDKTIVDCKINSQWLINAYGQETLNKISKNKISCSGTTIGTYSAIMNYLEKMIDQLVKVNDRSVGIDQGIHNYILHTNLIQNVSVFENFYGPVLTIHNTDEKNIFLNTDDYLIDRNGCIINVLHQYDRLSKKFRDQIKVYREAQADTAIFYT
ncbi:hypothetical protein [Myxosarcina sp. GI1]|uniref:hypothetical protein n=1 Tax=Myxosarcina sp. GI1 TaxID=1541065 RepID=UPI00055D7BB2|nr:hypothetical protein [Myxosarcina sp. GI1]